MRRREFLGILGGATAAWPLAARAQSTSRVPRIGFLGNSTAALEANLIRAFRDGLRDLGYIEGQNIFIEYRWAEGKYERFPALIGELISLKVDVMVTAGTPATLAVKKAATSIPLVMAAVGDPVGTGIVASLARPGGNITGLSGMAPDLEGKRLELLREFVPKLSRVGVFWNPTNAFNPSAMMQARAAAEVLRIDLLSPRSDGMPPVLAMPKPAQYALTTVTVASARQVQDASMCNKREAVRRRAAAAALVRDACGARDPDDGNGAGVTQPAAHAGRSVRRRRSERCRRAHPGAGHDRGSRPAGGGGEPRRRRRHGRLVAGVEIAA